jgi:hypothetical protein
MQVGVRMSLVTGKKKAIDPETELRLREAGAARAASRAKAETAESALRDVVLDALASGASVRVVAELAGVAPVTVAKWKANR